MAKYQPEGGYVPIAEDHPLHRKAIAGLLVVQLRLDRLTCKATLGQNRKPEDRRHVIERQWRRGARGDVEAIVLLLARFLEIATPALLELPEDVRDRSARF